MNRAAKRRLLSQGYDKDTVETISKLNEELMQIIASVQDGQEDEPLGHYIPLVN